MVCNTVSGIQELSPQTRVGDSESAIFFSDTSRWKAVLSIYIVNNSVGWSAFSHVKSCIVTDSHMFL